MTDRKRVHYTFDDMNDPKLCKCLCSETNIVTKDNITNIIGDVTCKNCLRFLRRRIGRIETIRDEKRKLYEERLRKLEKKPITKNELDGNDTKILPVFDNIMTCLLNELNGLSPDKKVVRVVITKEFDDDTYTSQEIKIGDDES